MKQCITIRKKISNEFANHFSSIGTNLSSKTPIGKNGIDHYLQKIARNLSSIFMEPCTEVDLANILSTLKSKSSSGYDGISNKLLKIVGNTLLKPLCYIINELLRLSCFPDAMKNAIVVPLHKGGPCFLVNNYHPISLLITLSKLLEKLVYKQVYSFLDRNKQFYKSQYGLGSKHSCEHAITELLGNILKGFERNKHTIAIFLDLSKAFDTLNHDILLSKLDRYGIRGICWEWFKSYLSNRTIQVCTNDILSDTKALTIRAPQGSCLGPLLFLIYCNDLYLQLELTTCILFANDTTLFKSHNDPSYLTWCMEHDLNILSEWFKTNKLTLNTNKSVCMFFNCAKREIIPIDISVDGSKLPYVTETKFLGVWIDAKLTWKTHIEKLLTKLHRGLSLIKQSKNLLPLHGKKILYFAQFYSHLQYGISLWGPMCLKTQLKKINSIHKKCLDEINQRGATGVLTLTELIDLECYKFGYKLVHKILPENLDKLCLTDAVGSNLKKDHHYCTRKKNIPNLPTIKNNQYLNSVLFQGISRYNQLPTEILKATSISLFVKQCKEHLLNKNWALSE